MRYSIGIDLGTTNSELAYCLLNNDGQSVSTPEIFKIPQFVETSVVESRTVLPSSLYIGPEEERESSSWTLPWDSVSSTSDEADNEHAWEKEPSRNGAMKRAKGLFKKVFGIGSSSEVQPSGVSNPNAFFLVGEIAARRAADSPERVVSSAKSWLTCARLDRRQPLLPWNIPDSFSKVSPVEASRRYLRHLVLAWNDAFPESPIFDQQVVLTVPASFDESARELTREAAGRAGLNLDTLLFLEEPQAALYAWLAHMGSAWRGELKVGDVVLVCDVGGGTTDLSLIRVEEEDGELVLRRLAVGNRLLLGGDNMDLALAHRAAELFSTQGVKLNPWQSRALWRQCREVKETLLASELDSDDESCKISILGRSSKLVGESTSVLFPKKDAVSIALEGFFPLCELKDRPKRRSGLGLRESGLPYEIDPAITKHLAAFLCAQTDESGTVVKPTKYLLNGGVFNSSLVASRFQRQLDNWFPESKPSNLHPAAELECAVARGASFYGAAKLGDGVRIRSASARSYYVGIETSAPAIPGFSRPIKALCVAPIGMEEGTERGVPSEPFELVVGESATFRFFSSTTRSFDQPGSVVDWYDSEDQGNDDDAGDLQETDPIETTFDVDFADVNRQDSEPEYVAVRFRSKITELGVMEVWCDEVDGSRSWKLEFNVRDERDDF